MSKKAKDNSKENKKNKNKKPRRFILFYIFFGFIFILLPLIHKTKTLDIVMMPRLYVLSIFLLIFSLLLLIPKTHFNNTSTVLKQYLFPVLGLWFLISAVSLLFATNPVEGLYDLIKVFYTIAIAVIASILFLRTENWQSKLIQIVVAGTIISCIVGFVQYYQRVYISGTPIIPDDLQRRGVIYLVDGLMAHKNLYSIFLFMLLPFTATGIFILNKPWKIISGIAVLMQLVLLFLLQTRAVWLGLIVATGITMIVLIIAHKNFHISKLWRRAILAAIFAGIIAVAGVLFLSIRESQNPYIQQFQSIIDPASPHNIHRINIWETTVKMIQDKPLTGFGAGNWKLHAGYYFEGRFLEEHQLNWQRPHNDFLWVQAEKGLVGFLLYLGIFVLCFFYIVKVIISSRSNIQQKILALFLVFGFTGYLTASFFDFPYERVTHQVLLGIFFACSTTMYHKTYPPKTKISINRYALLIPFVLVFCFGSIYGYKAVKQEVELKKARSHINIQNWNGVLQHAEKAENPLKNLDPQANPVISYKGLAYVNMGDIRNGLSTYREAYKQHPGSIYVLNNLGAALFENGQYEVAKEVLEKSVSIFPSFDGITNLSAVYYELEKYEAAYEILMDIPEELRTEQMLNNLRAIEEKIREEDRSNEL